MELSTKYNPKEVEDKWYKLWNEKGLFKPNSAKGKSYSIVIPPPNITGILHMGHALNNTIQDILIRYNRMKGLDTLWVPGTDHAGIATQNVVEKKLKKQGIKRQDLKRDEFLKHVWGWRKEYGDTIIHQLEKLGCSCDWSRTRFTMDEGLSRAVNEVFVKLYEENLIYRGNYIINWCPRCHTALSDEEAEHRQVQGKLYYIKYPVKGSSDYVSVATTRPETMLGDVAVAIHPKDKRLKALSGKKIILPILERELEVIKDSLVDSKFGTGIVKVTPAHDPNDFQMGINHDLTPICVLMPDAKMNDNAGPYKGMDRFNAREAILKDLKSKGLIEKIDDHIHQVQHCYRCHTIVEPLISKQWFVKMKPLAKPAIKAVKKKKIKFFPNKWEKVYLNWMENIRDWCISRQIWWGHRLPVYYCNDCLEPDNSKKGVIVSAQEVKQCPRCKGSNITQDEDVLDTWFSSWLWPFSTMGWPDKTKDLEYFYPTNALVTAQEIIFFWVARMVMAGLKFMNDIPFEHVYIHGTVRDDTGTKMSKSLGNIIDPIDIINRFGADALRFSVISITAMGQDVFLSTEKFHLGRNFSNKIWNASRLVLSSTKDGFSNCCLKELKLEEDNVLYSVNLWILDSLNLCIQEVDKALELYNFNQAADSIYHFLWHSYCDWYLELTKPILLDPEVKDKDKSLTKKTMLLVLIDCLKMLHPIMPFITEELLQKIKSLDSIDSIFPDLEEFIMISKWPVPDREFESKSLRHEVDLLINIITAVRNIKSELGISLSKNTDLHISCPRKDKQQLIDKYEYFIKNIVNVDELIIQESLKKPACSAVGVVEDMQIFIPLEGVIDFEKEKARIQKDLDETQRLINIFLNKINNKEFIKKAPKNVVLEEKEKYNKFCLRKEKLTKTLKDIS